jgi:hypothetical protein
MAGGAGVHSEPTWLDEAHGGRRRRVLFAPLSKHILGFLPVPAWVPVVNSKDKVIPKSNSICIKINIHSSEIQAYANCSL